MSDGIPEDYDEVDAEITFESSDDSKEITLKIVSPVPLTNRDVILILEQYLCDLVRSETQQTSSESH